MLYTFFFREQVVNFIKLCAFVVVSDFSHQLYMFEREVNV